MNYENGRIGSTLATNTFTKKAVTLSDALAKYEENLRRKVKDGYKPDTADIAEVAAIAPGVNAAPGTRTEYPAELLEAIEEEEFDAYCKNDDYAMQVKLDGQRCQIAKLPSGEVIRFNKLGESKPLPKAVHDSIQDIGYEDFVLDGELIGERFGAFDVFRMNGENLTKWQYLSRLSVLTKTITGIKSENLFVARTWAGTIEKRKGLAQLRKERAEGVAFKLLSAPYQPGRNGQHKKGKFWKSGTFKVIGMGHKGHNSATLALLKDGEWFEVGRASMNGKDKRIKVGSLVEVKFLYCTPDHRLYQPGIKEYRDDVRESECTMVEQLPKSAYKQTTVHD